MITIKFTIFKGNAKKDNKINQVIRIYIENFEKKLQVPKKIIMNRIRKGKYDLNIMEVDNIIVGFSFVVPFRQYKFIFIDYIAIDSCQQGKGYGKILFNHIYDYYINLKKIGNILVLECEDELSNMYIKWGCRKIPLNYNLNEDCHLNLMAKSELDFIFNTSKYYRIRSELLNLNKIFFTKNKFIQINNNYLLALIVTKCMTKLFMIIKSILRNTYGNSRIYYNFLENYP